MQEIVYNALRTLKTVKIYWTAVMMDEEDNIGIFEKTSLDCLKPSIDDAYLHVTSLGE